MRLTDRHARVLSCAAAAVFAVVLGKEQEEAIGEGCSA